MFARVLARPNLDRGPPGNNDGASDDRDRSAGALGPQSTLSGGVQDPARQDVSQQQQTFTRQAYKLFQRGLERAHAADASSIAAPPPDELHLLGDLATLEEQVGSCILADELNRSKISQIAGLVMQRRLPGTTLIVVRHELQQYWVRQFREQVATTSLRILDYSKNNKHFQGNQKQRRLHERDLGTYDVIITSYSTIDQEFRDFSSWVEMRDANASSHEDSQSASTTGKTKRKTKRKAKIHLQRPFVPLVELAYSRLVFDDGHKLANSRSHQFAALFSLQAPSRVIIAPPWFWSDQPLVLRYLQLLRIIPLDESDGFKGVSIFAFGSDFDANRREVHSSLEGGLVEQSREVLPFYNPTIDMLVSQYLRYVQALHFLSSELGRDCRRRSMGVG
jgi:SNF2-related domain